jgi:hypothetical protein
MMVNELRVFSSHRSKINREGSGEFSPASRLLPRILNGQKSPPRGEGHLLNLEPLVADHQSTIPAERAAVANNFGSLVFTPTVKAQQERHGSRRQYARMEEIGPSRDGLGAMEQEFIAERDSFYMASVGSNGWPYIQHRGGPAGFLKVIDDSTIAFANFSGNKQYISNGNLATDNRVALILVDYPRQARLKLLGRAEIVEGEQAREWIERVRLPDYKATIESVFVIHVEAFDWNCPQHITPRFTAEQIRNALEPAEKRVQGLEQENQDLRRQLSELSQAATQG